ncbi:MAG: hypothetical protein BWK76_03650 [Desulfobulbaceae bacterium A2]|nr:MAG: hypothetical protein BWK76_03650 [Desulfobulbaceae bacterium A2]
MKTVKTLGELLAGVEHVVRRGGARALSRRLQGVSDDSRRVLPGELFVVLSSEAEALRRHLAQALERGCRHLALAGRLPDGLSLPAGTVVLELRDPRDGLGHIAANWCGKPAEQLVIIGITGTNGKTTTSYLLEGVLREAGHRPGVIGTVNYRFRDTEDRLVERPASHTTPGPLVLQQLLRDMASAGVSHVVMEVSSHALHQQRLAGMLCDVAVFTNLSRDHLDYHRDWDAYFACKELLFTRYLRRGGTAVVLSSARQDEPLLSPAGRCWGARLVQTLRRQGFAAAKLRRSGPGWMLVCGDGPEAWLRADEVAQDLQGLHCTLHAGKASAVLESSLVGRHNLENLLCAAGAALACGLTLPQTCRGLAAVQRVPGRLDQVRLPETQAPMEAATLPAVFVDYAHSPDALAHVLVTLRELPHRRLVCVFGCGGDRDRGKRPQMGELAARLADRVVLTSDNPRSEAPESILAAIEQGVLTTGKSRVKLEALLATGAAGDYAVESDRRLAIRAAIALSAAGDIVLVAGKGHEQGQIIGGEVRPFDDRQEAASALALWRPAQLAAATGGVWQQSPVPSLVLSGHISTDSRNLRDGDVFVALRGERFDGHDFLSVALQAGARVLVVEEAPAALPPTAAVLVVPDTLAALGDLAAYRRRLLGGGLLRIAITGSSGKTTVKEMCAAICARHLHHADDDAGAHGRALLLKTQGNFNNLIGLPLTLLRAEPWHRIAVLEMGMNRPGEIARLTEIADPDIACINNVHAAHLLGLGSIEGVAAAKGELFHGLRDGAVLVVNLDDPHVSRQAAGHAQRRIGYALEPAHRPRAEVRASRLVNLGARGSRFTLHIASWQGRITLPVPGLHNVRNALAAAALAHAAGMGPEAVVAALAAYRPVDKRMQTIELAAGPSLLNDAYNANPASMAAALATVATFGAGRRMALLGDMLELGPGARAAHEEIGSLAARLGYDYLGVLGEFADVVSGAARRQGMGTAQVRPCRDHAELAAWVRELLQAGGLGAGDWIVLKGSRGMRMESVLTYLAPETGAVGS